ncbi:MAG: PEP-CTERM sorting domain-containing protein [Phycisphaerales bacterium]|jgi:hypothetical protein|nr:PEP-CTERM sorting domain-containing protein [Phycisphaerales bacterium]
MNQHYRFALVGAAVAAFAGLAQAGISQNVLSIDVSWEGGSTTWSLDREQLQQDPNDPAHFWWEPSSDIQIASGIELRRGTGSDRTRIEIFEDPEVIVNFNVFSAQQNSVFTVNSALVSFAQLNNPVGVASAAVSVTDLSGNGATYTPNGLGGQAYTAFYNTSTSEFAQLLSSPLTTLPFSTNSYSQDFPIAGTQGIAGSVDDISARWTFTLSQNALATGTSVFTVVVPTPASGLLLGAGVLVAGRRRR